MIRDNNIVDFIHPNHNIVPLMKVYKRSRIGKSFRERLDDHILEPKLTNYVLIDEPKDEWGDEIKLGEWVLREAEKIWGFKFSILISNFIIKEVETVGLLFLRSSHFWWNLAPSNAKVRNDCRRTICREQSLRSLVSNQLLTRWLFDVSVPADDHEDSSDPDNDLMPSEPSYVSGLKLWKPPRVTKKRRTLQMFLFSLKHKQTVTVLNYSYGQKITEYYRINHKWRLNWGDDPKLHNKSPFLVRHLNRKRPSP